MDYEYENKLETCCFSGYRPEKFPFRPTLDDPRYEKLLEDIRMAIADAAGDGFQYFLCGMARGFDILCGETLLKMRKEKEAWRDLKLIAVIPFPEYSESWLDEWNFRHIALKAHADDLVCTSESYHSNCYLERNRYMVDHSERLICYCDGKPGGTAYTVGYAQKRNIPIVNLASF